VRDVDADLIQQDEGAHGHAEPEERLVDLVDPASFFQHVQRLAQVGHEDPVHEESRAVVHDHGKFAELT
jgi:hypothetical protein